MFSKGDYEMRQIPLLSNARDKKQASFLMLVGADKIWQSYDGIDPELQQAEIPHALLINRADGKIGFPGGYVEKGETPRQGVLREVEEELGYKVPNPDLVKPLISFEMGIVVHVFMLELPYNELKAVLAGMVNAPHFGSEVSGAFLAQLATYTRRGRVQGYPELMRSNLVITVKECLDLYLRTAKPRLTPAYSTAL